MEITPLIGLTVVDGTDALLRLARKRDGEGFGQLEIAIAGTTYPLLTVFFNNDSAVILRIDEEGGDVMITEGDGSVSSSQTLDFRGPVGPEQFTGAVIVRAALAYEILRAFADGVPWPPEARWIIQ